MGMQTRWHHLSDKELLDYRDVLTRTTTGVEVEPAMAEELFNRLEKNIDARREMRKEIESLEFEMGASC
jgi:hypothetical protein